MDYTKISKFISLLLRHKPEEANLTLDEHGWCKVDDLVSALSERYKVFTFSDLEKIVADDKKGRYSFNDDKSLIRANQGHSIDVDVELEEVKPEFNLYHGTATRFVESILKDGLKPLSRQYVHLSKDIDTAVKVGQRHGKPYIFEIDVNAMLKDGYMFYISKNGVYLTKEVPPKYFKDGWNHRISD